MPETYPEGQAPAVPEQPPITEEPAQAANWTAAGNGGQGAVPPYGMPPVYQQPYASPYSGVYPGYPPQPQNIPPAQGYGYPYDPRYAAQQPQPVPQAGWNPAVMPPKPEKKKAGKMICIAVAALLECALIGFASFGVYALCTGNYGNRTNSTTQNGGYQRPDFSQNQPDFNFGGNQNGGSENSTSVRMGLTCSMLTEAQAASINVESGMLVAFIDSDSDAKNKNLAVGDVITQIDGKKMTSFDDYYAAVADKKAGDTVELTVVKVKETKNDQGVYDTETVSVTLTLLEKTSGSQQQYPVT